MTVVPKQLSDQAPDGCLMGYSASDKIGFYGLATPIIQPTATAQGAITVSTITTASRTTTNPYGWADSTQANAIAAQAANAVTLLNALRSALVALNLIAGA